MNTRKDKIKEQNKLLSKSLDAAERSNKRRKQKRTLQGKFGEVLIDLGKLLFGGVIVSGLFVNTAMPLFLYIAGVVAFAATMSWGFYIYNKSLMED